MGKDKLKRFAEMKEMPNVLEPQMIDFIEKGHELKGKWGSDFFKDNKAIVLELGCGRGEYTVAMAQENTENNFIGVDIKGARMWRGAKTSIEEGIKNTAFLRTRIEWIGSFFAENEISEIWITFPDPQLKERRAKKRLTSRDFLNTYKKILKPGGKVHLKTDSRELYDYTKEILQENSAEIKIDIADLYAEENILPILEVKTHYEEIFLKEGKKITYLQFNLDKDTDYVEPPQKEDSGEEGIG